MQNKCITVVYEKLLKLESIEPVVSELSSPDYGGRINSLYCKITKNKIQKDLIEHFFKGSKI